MTEEREPDYEERQRSEDTDETQKFTGDRATGQHAEKQGESTKVEEGGEDDDG
jgi:hypothetical protein